MEHVVYLGGLKRALRAQGLTYADLAARLKMTESGVKKMLNAKDISFRRVLQICEALNVLPGQLFSLSEKAAIPVLRISDAQQGALLRDRNLLGVYWRLAIEKRGLTEVQRRQGLNAPALKKLLQKLVTLELLTEKRGQFYPKHRGKFRWADDTKLAQTLNREWSFATLERALRSAGTAEHYHRLAALKLSEKSYRDLWAKWELLLEEAVRISEREELSAPARDLRDYTLLLGLVPGSPLDHSR